MSEFLEIAAGVAIVAYVIGRQLLGEPLRGKRVVVLPIVLTVIGITDLGGNHQPVKPVDVVCLVVGGLVTAAIGLSLGIITRVENRDGALWGKLPARGLWLWLLLIVSRLVTTLVADGLDAKVAASSSTILLMLGINRLAQAAVVMTRAVSSGVPFAPEKDGRQLFSGLTTPQQAAPSSPAPVPVRQTGVDWETVGRHVSTYLENRRRDR